ncbi:RICIN domain-containing protein [Streptomyces sp. NBC_01622]|uniref:RICIN domain-containing protein n=1 Tax=Streptomyces sp. NBC_01622 TaxID=2975903 RepID=UPI0038689BE1|nr:RICIN domain-containing protein [Streptomyces sp. NBC_01622]
MVALLLAGIGSILGVTGANAQTAPSTVATPLVGEFHRILNVASGKCLQPQSTSFGAPIVQKTCDGSSAQGWFALDMGSNHFRFLNPSGWCMFVSDTLTNGGPVWQDECAVAGGTTVSNAEWKASAALPNDVTLRSHVHFVDTNFCLDVPGGSTAEGLAVQVWTCSGTYNPNQHWIVGLN